MRTQTHHRLIMYLTLVVVTSLACSLTSRAMPSPSPQASLTPEWTPAVPGPEKTSQPTATREGGPTATPISPEPSPTSTEEQTVLPPGTHLLYPRSIQHEELGQVYLDSPQFSPDGHWMAVWLSTETHVGDDFVIVEATCAETTEGCEKALIAAYEALQPSDRPLDISWSPDSDQVAVVYQSASGYVLRFVRVGERGIAGQLESSLPALSWYADVSWSPAGDRLLFSGQGAVYSTNADGSDWTMVREGACCPVWSPDGQRIALQEQVPDGPDNWLIVDRQGRELSRPCGGGLWAGWSGASWSPDSERVALECYDADLPRSMTSVFVANADGSKQTNITLVPAVYWNNESPAWSPDGRYIAFGSRQDCEMEDCPPWGDARDIFLIRISSMELLRVTDTGHAICPRWVPNSGRLVFESEAEAHVWVDIEELP